MNTLLQIRHLGFRYCYCEQLENSEEKICKIPVTFFNFDKNLRENMLDAVYLQSYNSNLFGHLSNTFYNNKALICCFLNA